MGLYNSWHSDIFRDIYAGTSLANITIRFVNRAVFKVITMVNHNNRKQSIEPMRTRSKYTRNRRQVRENASDQVAIGLIIHLIG